MKAAVGRVIYSLRDWGILLQGKNRNIYVPQRNKFNTSNQEIEIWLLACALCAAPNEEMPVPDLLNLSALFPFHLTVSTSDLRSSHLFEVSRQGMGLNMVRNRFSS